MFLITIATGFALSLLLSACAATNRPPEAEPALGNLQQAVYNYARYHELALRQVYPEQSRRAQDRLPDDRRIVAELLDVPVEKADSHLPHIASLTRWHICTVE